MKLDAKIDYTATPEVRFGQWFTTLLAANLTLGMATGDPDPKTALEATLETTKDAYIAYEVTDRGRRGGIADEVFWLALVEASGYRTCPICSGTGEVGGEYHTTTCKRCGGESVVPDETHDLHRPKPIKPFIPYDPFNGFKAAGA